MKLENYDKISKAVQEIDMLKSVITNDGFDLSKALWIMSHSEKYKDLKMEINAWALNEIMPAWDEIIKEKIKELEKL